LAGKDLVAGQIDRYHYPEVAGQFDHSLMLQPAFANAGTTRVQLSDFTARRMFTAYFVERGATEGVPNVSKAGASIMVDQEVLDSQVKTDRFPFPSEGDITLGVRNTNYTLGPVMLQIGMKPGAVIPAHLHKGMAEALYIVEGDFTNEGKQYQAGTSLHFKAGKVHGPHTTKNGCKLLVLWTERSSKESADLSDFTLATQRAA
jgi:quercetin dioxygenase-like cupin family protein